MVMQTKDDAALSVASPSPVLALFQQALEKGAEAASAMETLYKLHVAEREHGARLSFFNALAAFQSECPPVPKTSAGQPSQAGGKPMYTYADFEQIVETISPHLRRNGLSYFFDTEMHENGTLRVTCRLSHVDGHAEAANFTLPTTSKTPAMSAQQAVGAARTFAKRCTLMDVLGLALTDPEPEGARASDPTTISEDQAFTIHALIEETGTDAAKLLAWVKVPSVEAIRAADFLRVVRALESKRNGGAK